MATFMGNAPGLNAVIIRVTCKASTSCLSSPSRGRRSSQQQRVCVCVFWVSKCGERTGCGCVREEGRQGWGTQHTYMTRVQLPLLHNNNNRRRDVFCGEEEARDGRLKRKEDGKNQNGRRK